MGTPCTTDAGVGNYCQGQQCTSGCLIGGTFWASGTINSNNPCQQCTPSASSTSWTILQDGVGCGNGQLCSAGQCGTQCDMGDAGIVPTGTVNPGNPCQSCQPYKSVTSWSNLADGVGCGTGTGQICFNGNCGAGCDIAAVFYNTGTPNPNNTMCQSCVPTMSTGAWTNAADGTACANFGVCTSGACGCAAGQECSGWSSALSAASSLRVAPGATPDQALANCVIQLHQSDCCGAKIAYGFNHAALTQLCTAESACKYYSPPGCANTTITTDTSEMTTDASQVRVRVVNPTACAYGTCYTCETFVCTSASCMTGPGITPCP
jgi:hypothetical protein